MTDEYYELQKTHRANKQRGQEKFQQNSKARLIKNLKAKFTTTMIGALAAFEAEFGELWGNGRDVAELDDDQMEERERWERVRAQILDNGNNQARAATDEIAHYTVSWNRYVTKFVTKTNPNTNDNRGNLGDKPW